MLSLEVRVCYSARPAEALGTICNINLKLYHSVSSVTPKSQNSIYHKRRVLIGAPVLMCGFDLIESGPLG